MTSTVLLTAFILITIVLLVYYLGIFLKLSFYKPQYTENQPKVSILISARNELTNLKENLPVVLAQDYPQYEVIVINDHSFDGTKDYLKELEDTHKILKVTSLYLEDNYQKGKKFALTMGIKSASFDRLVFIDADCKPASDQWLKELIREGNDKPIILGFSPLTTSGGLLGEISKYETFHTGLSYLSYSLIGQTYMGVGRNLSYTKELFLKNRGFANHQHILSGDDDLLIQEIADKTNTALAVGHHAHMPSTGPKSFNHWFKQKMRHISTSKHYTSKFKMYLGFYAMAVMLFYPLGILTAIFTPYLLIVLAIYTLKIILQSVVYYRPTKQLGYEYIFLFVPFYDLIYSLTLYLFSIVKPFYKVKKWN